MHVKSLTMHGEGSNIKVGVAQIKETSTKSREKYISINVLIE